MQTTQIGQYGQDVDGQHWAAEDKALHARYIPKGETFKVITVYYFERHSLRKLFRRQAIELWHVAKHLRN